ncbi:hypothetical protein GGR52DRAFT_571912 [Hypoxylon sp. FL1284]|nr:hypothetical protein GGR52DRAFT_571912 [Hypoxylon sp. FL1284]
MDIHASSGDAYNYYPTAAAFVRRPSPARQPSFRRRAGSGGMTPNRPPSSAFASENRDGGDEGRLPGQLQLQRAAADQAYREMFALHERAVFQEEVRARIRRREAARNEGLQPRRFYQRPECWAITLAVLGLLYPILNQYVVQRLLAQQP